MERYLGEVLIDERQYESLEDLTETELEALDFSELVSVTDEAVASPAGFWKTCSVSPALSSRSIFMMVAFPGDQPLTADEMNELTNHFWNAR